MAATPSTQLPTTRPQQSCTPSPQRRVLFLVFGNKCDLDDKAGTWYQFSLSGCVLTFLKCGETFSVDAFGWRRLKRRVDQSGYGTAQTNMGGGLGLVHDGSLP